MDGITERRIRQVMLEAERRALFYGGDIAEAYASGMAVVAGLVLDADPVAVRAEVRVELDDERARSRRRAAEIRAML